MREISSVQVSFVVIGSWALASTGSSRKLVARFRIGLSIERDVEKPDHHLFPALVAPADFMSGVRIVLVVDRVVEVRRAFDDRAFGQLQRLRQSIGKLPTEAVVGYLEQRLLLAIGKHQTVLEIFTAKMHVREQTSQRGIALEGVSGFHFVI